MRSCSPSRYSVSTVSSVRQMIRRGGNWRIPTICRIPAAMSRQPLPRRSLPALPPTSILSEKSLQRKAGGLMTPLEKIQSMKMPFAELKGVTFTEAGLDRVVAKMLVRPDLCTLRNTIHGGAIMAFADSVGAAATVINLPADAKGTTTLHRKTNFSGGAQGAGAGAG